jgi:D-glycero-D-manno-heptose 1,7-bisphosphate phosphatase
MRRAIFLDRDGVINSMVYNPEFGLVDSPANPGEFQLIHGTPEAIHRINDLGLLAVLISNQPGIAKGKFSVALLEAMTEKMRFELAQQAARLDAVYYCFHHPEGVVPEYRRACECRKPRPGMLLQAAADLDIDLQNSYFIGDGITDIQAGQAAGVATVLIYPSLRCYLCEELNRRQVKPDYIVKNLSEAVDLIEEGH